MGNVKATRPFVIWTLQRTGGTNLTQRLIELSGLRSAEHEPFNPGRQHGRIVQHWLQHHDATALDQAVAGVAARGEVIKHCVEMVPPDVNRALAKASSAAGYGHLFLYRKQALSRLLSLHFANVSGIWGPQMNPGSFPALHELERRVLPVSKLAAHEQRCAAALKLAWQELLALDQVPVALAYEDLYAAASRSDALGCLSRLLPALGMSLSPSALAESLEKILGQGEQGTRRAYELFEGADALNQALANVDRFVPAPPLVCRELVQPPPSVPWVRAVILDHAQAVVPRRSKLGGLVVLAPNAPMDLRLRLRQGGVEDPVHWNIRSPWAERNFPEAPNAAAARFAITGELRMGACSLVIESAALAETQTCATIVVRSATPQELVDAALALKAEAGEEAELAAAYARDLDGVPPQQRNERWAQARTLMSPQSGNKLQ
jgi:hypothetical protein